MYPAGIAGLSQRKITLASGLKVRVVESGPADGPPVVLLSGWGGCVYMWRKNLPALAEAGLRVIAVDLKGQGLSDKPLEPAEYTSEKMTAHALEILDALKLKRVRLVGQSMAGKIAADVALAAPDELARLTMPVLIVAGSEDHVVDPKRVDRVAARLKDARTLIVPGAGHVPNEEAAEKVNRALVEFLRP
jgi:pimeloyl-ACP methyl ester carboxylesterase